MKDEKLHSAFSYFDNIIIIEHAQGEHNQNIEEFLKVIGWRHLKLQNTMIMNAENSINVLGYFVVNGIIKPSPVSYYTHELLPSVKIYDSQRHSEYLNTCYCRGNAKLEPLFGIVPLLLGHWSEVNGFSV